MRGTVAKRLRRHARIMTAGMLARSKLPPLYRQGGTFRHGDQTTRAVYQRLKREGRSAGSHR